MRSATVLILLLVFASCGRDVDPEHRPDQLLRDSLGLTDADRVYRVRLGALDNREQVEPAEVRIRSGSWVEFVTTDGRIHTVTFELDSLSSPAADVLRGSGQDRSPPLLEESSRFLVHFREAPAGRYPFVVDGNGSPVRGTVIVEEQER